MRYSTLAIMVFICAIYGYDTHLITNDGLRFDFTRSVEDKESN